MLEKIWCWICIFVVCLPTLVQTLSKCSKVDVCRCSTDEGTIDLWSLAGKGSNIPRFKDISVKGGETSEIKVSWNPCNKWSKESTPITKANNCNDIAVCFDVAGFLLADVGEQGTADFNVNTTSGRCVLSLTGKAIPGGPSSSSTDIILQCDPHEEGVLESVTEPVFTDEHLQIPLTLRSKYACPVKSGLSTGSILVIVMA